MSNTFSYSVYTASMSFDTGGECSNAVLLSEEDWKAIQETVHLLSVPGMRESIKKG
jgi:PHD/YefM family antitoxin component YafN of YafNO toxin-antitoxin module